MRVFRSAEFTARTVVGRFQPASAINQRGTVAPWSSEDSVMEAMSSPRRVHRVATMSASIASAGRSMVRCGTRNARSDPRRRSPRQIPTGLDMHGECGDITTRVSAAAAMIDRAALRIAERVVAMSSWRGPPTPGTRIGACGRRAPQTTLPARAELLTERARHPFAARSMRVRRTFRDLAPSLGTAAGPGFPRPKESWGAPYG